jgi:CubicO group peptidase (beta-lactamase class C family)
MMTTTTKAWLSICFLVPLSVCAAQETTPPSVSLHLAALQGNMDAVRRHIEAGTDLNEKDAYGSSALIIAATFGRGEVAAALIEAGADLSITNNDGATPLHIAAFLGRTAIVEALLAGGANKYLRDNVGNTPRDVVSAPFDDVRGLYDALAQSLGPLGLQVDYEQLRVTRPRIAEMLRPSAEELRAVRYTPLPGDDWAVSTPREEGLDPTLVAELYLDAAKLWNLYGLLVIKNGRIIGEGYFNGGAVDRKNKLQSVTKSYTSALVGVALDRGCLSGVDQRMVDFFPEFAGRMQDPRKEQITIRDLLQMRGGYPWEERVPPYADTLYFSENWHWLPHIVDFPLLNDPGTAFGYSNLTSHVLGVIVARACDTDLQAFGKEHLFSRIDAEVGDWSRDADGYNFGSFEISFTPRDMAKFGMLYLNRGEFEGSRVLPADWISESLERYSDGMYDNQWRGEGSYYLGPYFRDVGYGYQWWSARVGEHNFDLAWGHGGNLIVLLDGLNMIVVTAADPLYDKLGREAWKDEGAVINLVGKFIKSLPEE